MATNTLKFGPYRQKLERKMMNSGRADFEKSVVILVVFLTRNIKLFKEF